MESRFLQEESFQIGFKVYHRFIFVLFCFLSFPAHSVGRKDSRNGFQKISCYIESFFRSIRGPRWRQRILNIILGIVPLCFLHPFLGFTRPYQLVHRLIKMWWPDKDSKLFRKCLGILPGLKKFFNYGPCEKYLRKVTYNLEQFYFKGYLFNCLFSAERQFRQNQ